MIRKIFVALFAVLLVLAMLLSGCSGPEDKKTGGAGDASGYPVDALPKGPADSAYPGP